MRLGLPLLIKPFLSRRGYTSVSFIAPLVATPMTDKQPRLQTLAQLIPPLTYDMHKGDCGRVAVIGGCEEYTGAPYFVASSSLRLGTDIAYVICERDAAPVIKAYSPDLIVNPYLRSTSNRHDGKWKEEEAQTKIGALLSKCHGVSVGSGMGNDESIRSTAEWALNNAKRHGLPLVLDADSLALVCKSPDLVKGYSKAVLTPNPPEFMRLCDALGISNSSSSDEDMVNEVARQLGGITVVRKGRSDIISNGKQTFVCEEKGGLRRCGGQGDILSGSILTFLAWGEKYKQRNNDSRTSSGGGGENNEEDIPMLAAYAGCMLTRHASFLAYDECGRATMSSNVLEQIDIAFDNKFEEILKAFAKKPTK